MQSLMHLCFIYVESIFNVAFVSTKRQLQYSIILDKICKKLEERLTKLEKESKKETYMASSSSYPHVTLEVGEECPYPYPSHVCAPNFVTLKLSGKDKYNIWKTQILCLLESHGMVGFIDGTFVSPYAASSSVSGKEKAGEHHNHRLWRRSDALIKGWILASLSEETLTYVVDRLTERLHHQERCKCNAGDFSAKHVWDELHTMYAPALLPQRIVADKQEEEIASDTAYLRLHQAVVKGCWSWVDEVLREKQQVTVVDKITKNGNTALHVAVGNTKKVEFLEKLLERIPESTQVLDVRNSDGSTPLHVAAIVGNLEAAEMLVENYPDLLLAKDNEGQTPLALAFSNMHIKTARYLWQHINTDIQKDTLFSGPSGDELLVTLITSKDFRLAKDLLERYTRLHRDAALIAIAQNLPKQT